MFLLSCFLVTRGPPVAWTQNSAPADWPLYARDYGSTGYSPLSEIKPENVSSLRQICSYALPEQSTFESSLVVLNGTMYFTTSEYTYAVDASNCSLRWRVRVTAIDADTGVIRWRHETPAPMVAGIAVTATGIVFTAGLDGDSIALDAATGKVFRRIPTQQPAGGGVVTYQAGGKQRVAVATGLENNILQTKGEPVIIVYGL